MTESSQVLNFRELLLTGLKESATKPNIYGWEPNSEVQEAFHKSTHTGRLFLGGNRSGKTVSGAVETVWRLLGQHPYQAVHPAPIRARGSAVDIEQGLNKIMLPEIRRWLPPSALLNGSWEDSYHKQGRVLTLRNGSTMDFLTYEMGVEKHAGTSRHWQWFDEEPPQFIYNEDLLRLVDVDGKWCMSMTPIEGMTWVYYDIVRPVLEEEDPAVRDQVAVFQISTAQNKYVKQEVLDNITRGMSEEEKLARKHGTFMAASGLIFPQFNEKVHVIPPVDLSAACKRPTISGMDHGLRNPTAWLWCVIDGEGRLIVVHEYYQAERTVKEHSDEIKSFEGSIPGYNHWYRIGDPAIAQRSAISGGSIQSEYSENGIYIGLGNNDVNYGLNRVRQYFENDGIFICSNCIYLIKELRNYRWDTWATRKQAADKEAKDKPKKVKDHAVDTLRYIVASRPEDEFVKPAGNLYLPFGGMSVQMPSNPTEVTEKHFDLANSESNHQILGDDW